MTTGTAVRLVEITQRKANELFDELINELQQSGFVGEEVLLAEVALDRQQAAPTSGYEVPWSLDSVTLPEGGWEKIGSEEGATYTWPDSSVETFHPLDTYTGTGERSGITLSLGHKSDGVVIGFFGSGNSKRGLTVFFKADDFEQSNELVSMIRGGGKRGRAGFGPADAAPPAYSGFKTEMLRDRVQGKWNVLAAIMDADDTDAMLNHTALQAKLRGLI